MSKLRYSEKRLEELKLKFDIDYQRYNQHVKSFSEYINEILDGETETSFANKTHLSPNMLNRITKYVCRNDPPQRSTIISIAVGYNLDYQITSKLLESLGLGFILSNPRDYAYQFLLTNCRGLSVDECNDVLELLGIEEKHFLGAHARKTKQ